MEKNEKYLEYAAQLTGAINEVFNEDNDYHINQEELGEGDNMTQFIHALSNLMPTHMFNSMTESDKNHLEFNHVANQLCFQYSTKSDE